jgi:S1-C subfamily serine protease
MRGRVQASQLAALLAAGVVGGAVAVGGVALFGGLGGDAATVVETSRPARATSAASARSLTVNEIYRRSAPGVVQITVRTAPQAATDPFFGSPFSTPGQEVLGSGFVVDKAGHVVTNYHVIDGAANIEVGFSDRESVQAKVVGSDPSTDLAVLEVDASSRALTPLPLGNSDLVEVGDQVVAIGNPFGLERTVTAGIVSALQRAVTAPNGYTIDHVIQTDAPINKGNSGGPLLNARGEVIGVNAQIESGAAGAGNVGIGFAVPSNTVKSVVAQILANGKVDRAYIGVSLTAVTPDLARLFRLPTDTGLLVEGVAPGSPGARAGLEGGTTEAVVAGEGYRLGGDVIVAADGERVTSVGDLRDVLAEHKPGDTIPIEIYRGEEKRTIKVKLGRQPTAS